MIRELTEEERKIVEKQIKNHEDKKEVLKKEFEYNKDILKLQQAQREHEDKFRLYLRERKDRLDTETLKQYESDIQEHEEHIVELTKQLNEGVEVKQPQGV